MPDGARRLRRRILSPCWSAALADGRNFVETIRYKTTSTSPLRFGKPGSLFAFGPTGSNAVDGIACCAQSAVLGAATAEAHKLLTHVPDPSLHQPLLSYLSGGTEMDYVEVAWVHDLCGADVFAQRCFN